MKVLLMTPAAPRERLWGRFHRAGGTVPPLGLLCVAAAARAAGHAVEVFDAAARGAGPAELERRLSGGYDAVGIQCFTSTADLAFASAAAARRLLPEALIVLGGVHPTVLPESALTECPDADAAVIGEGERSFCDLLDFKAGRRAQETIDGIAYRQGGAVLRTAARAPAADLDALPSPAYDLLELEAYVPHPTQYRRLPCLPVYASRGCPHGCTFCSASAVHGRRVRRKSLDRLFAEIDRLVAAGGARGLYIQDSSFLESADYAGAFCERLLSGNYGLSWTCNTRADQLRPDLARLLRRAGCWQVNIGAESASDASLALIRKGADRAQTERAAAAARGAGLQLFSSYILGLPGETAEDAEETIAFARGLGSHTAIFYLPVPYPGTELREQCRRDGGLREDAPWKDYGSADFSDPVYVNPAIGRERLQALYRKAYLSFYTDPRTLARNLATLRSTADLRYYWRAALALSGLLR